MNLKKIGLAAVIAAASSSVFAVSSAHAFDVAGDGELVLNVWNNATKSSITVDLDVAASQAPLHKEFLTWDISGLDLLGFGDYDFNVTALNSEPTGYTNFTGIDTSTGGYIYATAQNAPLLTGLNSSLFANQLSTWEDLVSTVTNNGTEVVGAANETWAVIGDPTNFAGDKDVFGTSMASTGKNSFWGVPTAATTGADGKGSSYAYFLGHALNFDSGNFEETYPVIQSEGVWTLDTTAGTLSYSAIPVPAAVWMFASGLLGLAGIARRNKKA